MLLSRVVEDDAERVSAAGTNSADAVAEIDAVCALGALHGPVMHGEEHRIALP